MNNIVRPFAFVVWRGGHDLSHEPMQKRSRHIGESVGRILESAGVARCVADVAAKPPRSCRR